MIKVTDQQYTANDDVYIFELKKHYNQSIDLDWFIYQFQDLFFQIVTSKSDNATFNKEYCESMRVLIPDFSKVQNNISARVNILKILESNVFILLNKIEQSLNFQLEC